MRRGRGSIERFEGGFAFLSFAFGFWSIVFALSLMFFLPRSFLLLFLAILFFFLRSSREILENVIFFALFWFEEILGVAVVDFVLSESGDFNFVGILPLLLTVFIQILVLFLLEFDFDVFGLRVFMLVFILLLLEVGRTIFMIFVEVV